MIALNTLRPNFTEVRIGLAHFWFSYKTCIAFRVAGSKTVVRRNDWGPTTGKHLNEVDGGAKETRIAGDAFEKLLAEVMPK